MVSFFYIEIVLEEVGGNHGVWPSYKVFSDSNGFDPKRFSRRDLLGLSFK
jgi:hypothetical protein